ncbi:hypothetical protein PDJAM_G00184010 [Pangasius djambal]|uniref:Uncharacterized protein n=1 Tax=Pangasius djambal TaxID=1691987 RepID=A0ACC5Y3T7_9TELE|nr:hypothetical protein [Pangasius djambal]
MRRRVDETAASKPTEEKSVKSETGKVQARSSWWMWVKRGLIALCTLYVATPFVLRFFPGVIQAAPHRLGVANVLSALGYHAVVMDYRGFGDSTGEPTEAGLTTDALYLYHWVRARSKGSLVIIWGHSLGTG